MSPWLNGTCFTRVSIEHQEMMSGSQGIILSTESWVIQVTLYHDSTNTAVDHFGSKKSDWPTAKVYSRSLIYSILNLEKSILISVSCSSGMHSQWTEQWPLVFRSRSAVHCPKWLCNRPMLIGSFNYNPCKFIAVYKHEQGQVFLKDDYCILLGKHWILYNSV